MLEILKDQVETKDYTSQSSPARPGGRPSYKKQTRKTNASQYSTLIAGLVRMPRVQGFREVSFPVEIINKEQVMLARTAEYMKKVGCSVMPSCATMSSLIGHKQEIAQSG